LHQYEAVKTANVIVFYACVSEKKQINYFFTSNNAKAF